MVFDVGKMVNLTHITVINHLFFIEIHVFIVY